jgi:hypothetical protein
MSLWCLDVVLGQGFDLGSLIPTLRGGRLCGCLHPDDLRTSRGNNSSTVTVDKGPGLVGGVVDPGGRVSRTMLVSRASRLGSPARHMLCKRIGVTMITVVSSHETSGALVRRAAWP